jgi:hypothetical protein
MRTLIACSLSLIIVACVGAPTSGQDKPYAVTALQRSVPDPWTPSGEFLGMSHFTAAELNRIHQGAGWGPIKFVDANTPSSRPDEVSVNPTDYYTWGAAAKSARDRRCYIIVFVFERTNPKHGGTRYGRLPKGSRCVGSAAIPTMATSEQPLLEG